MYIRKVLNSNANDNYYYHQLEFISNEDIKKENNSTLLDIPGKARELFSSVSNLSQKNSTVKSSTVLNLCYLK